MWEEWLFLTPFIVIPIFIIAVFLHRAHWVKTFTDGRGFSDYKEAHSANVRGGKVTCCSCGSDSIYLRRLGTGFGSVLNSHVCRQCGSELYRSKTPI